MRGLLKTDIGSFFYPISKTYGISFQYLWFYAPKALVLEGKTAATVKWRFNQPFYYTMTAIHPSLGVGGVGGVGSFIKLYNPRARGLLVYRNI